MPVLGFEIDASISTVESGAFEWVGSEPAGVHDFSLGGLPHGATVSFRVIASGFEEGGDSAPAASSGVTMPADDIADWATIGSDTTAPTDAGIAWAATSLDAGVYRATLQDGGDHDAWYSTWTASQYVVTGGG